MAAQNTSDQSGSSGTTSGSSGQTSGSKSGNETTISGCLMSSGGTYTLTDASGVQYQLSGDTSKLSSHVHQQVQVRGTSSSASGSTNSGPLAAPQGTGTQGSGTATTAGNFMVSRVKKISDSCSASK